MRELSRRRQNCPVCKTPVQTERTNWSVCLQETVRREESYLFRWRGQWVGNSQLQWGKWEKERCSRIALHSIGRSLIAFIVTPSLAPPHPLAPIQPKTTTLFPRRTIPNTTTLKHCTKWLLLNVAELWVVWFLVFSVLFDKQVISFYLQPIHHTSQLLFFIFMWQRCKKNDLMITLHCWILSTLPLDSWSPIPPGKIAQAHKRPSIPKPHYWSSINPHLQFQ